MLAYITLLIILTLAVVFGKMIAEEEESIASGFWAGSFALLISGLLGALIIWVIIPVLTIEYRTDYSRPLEQASNGMYHRPISVNGITGYQYKTVNGPVRIVSESDDDSEDEVNLYFITSGTPRVERRCSYPPSWVLPLDWKWRGYNGCDTNLYVPAEVTDKNW